MCFDDLWGLIAENNWDNDDASVVCSQLGYQRNGWLCVCINVHVLKVLNFYHRSHQFH